MTDEKTPQPAFPDRPIFAAADDPANWPQNADYTHSSCPDCGATYLGPKRAPKCWPCFQATEKRVGAIYAAWLKEEIEAGFAPVSTDSAARRALEFCADRVARAEEESAALRAAHTATLGCLSGMYEVVGELQMKLNDLKPGTPPQTFMGLPLQEAMRVMVAYRRGLPMPERGGDIPADEVERRVSEYVSIDPGTGSVKVGIPPQYFTIDTGGAPMWPERAEFWKRSVSSAITRLVREAASLDGSVDRLREAEALIETMAQALGDAAKEDGNGTGKFCPDCADTHASATAALDEWRKWKGARDA